MPRRSHPLRSPSPRPKDQIDDDASTRALDELRNS
jgi:hypothetical protein